MLREFGTYNARMRGASPALLRANCDCPAGYECYALTEGETLLGVARRYGVSLRQLLEANPGLNPYYYRAGDIICVPSRQGVCEGGRMYIVVRGDTLYNLSERFGVSFEAMLAANPTATPDRLSIGQVLCIPASATEPPVQEPLVEPEIPQETAEPVTPAEPVETPPAETATPEEAAAAPQEPTSEEAPPAEPVTETPVSEEPTTEAPTADECEQVPVLPAIPSQTDTGVNAASAAPSCAMGSPYTVAVGEGVTDILLRLNISYGALQLANPNTNLLNVRSGDTLCVPAESTTGGCMDGAGAYVIMTGDTLPSLAQTFGVTMLEILVNNPLMAPGDFVVGRVICMPVSNT